MAKPFLTFDSHVATNGLTFSPGGAFGFDGDAFVAQFGTFAPVTTGVNVRPAGFGVARVDMKTREIYDFAGNDLPGPAHLNQQNGFNRPTDLVFGPDRSLYVVVMKQADRRSTGRQLNDRSGLGIEHQRRILSGIHIP